MCTFCIYQLFVSHVKFLKHFILYILFFTFSFTFSSRHLMTTLQVPSPENRIQLLKGVNIVLPGNQHTQDKRGLFPSPDTTVTVSIAPGPNYPVKTEGSSHGFSVTVPNPHCSETDSHTVVFDPQLPHNQFSPNTQPRTPDSTFPENSDVSSHTHTYLLSPTQTILHLPGDSKDIVVLSPLPIFI